MNEHQYLLISSLTLTHVNKRVTPVRQIFVMSLNGRTIALEVEDDILVLEVKQQIEDIEGIPLNQQRLVFSGKQMEDPRTLRHYNVRNNSTVSLLLRLRGGGKKLKAKKNGCNCKTGCKNGKCQCFKVRACCSPERCGCSNCGNHVQTGTHAITAYFQNHSISVPSVLPLASPVSSPLAIVQSSPIVISDSESEEACTSSEDEEEEPLLDDFDLLEEEQIALRRIDENNNNTNKEQEKRDFELAVALQEMEAIETEEMH